ncbi:MULTISPECIES: hypothetical protein [unclassified Microcoleus]|uniref:hypothetical protein n=1 Tax=unclassified Microcoleus TaxID=2642155 RepID=UPI002FD77A1E
MPDRIIAATGLYLNVPVISRDRRIQLSSIDKTQFGKSESLGASLNFPATVVSGFACVTGLGGLLMRVRMGGAIVSQISGVG